MSDFSQKKTRCVHLFASPLVVSEAGNVLDILNHNKDKKALLEALREFFPIDIDFTSLVATPDNIHRVFVSGAPEILHVSGHGAPDTGHFLLEDIQGKALQWKLGPLTTLLNSKDKEKKMRLAILAACFSLNTGELLVDAGVKHVVCFRGKVADEVASKFAEYFYSNLRCSTVLDAFNGALAVLRLNNLPIAEESVLLLPRNKNQHEVKLFDELSVPQLPKPCVEDKSPICEVVGTLVPPNQFVPRKTSRELSDVYSLLSRTDETRSRCVMLQGERGLGKSALLFFLIKHLIPRNLYDVILYVPVYEALKASRKPGSASQLSQAILQYLGRSSPYLSVFENLCLLLSCPNLVNVLQGEEAVVQSKSPGAPANKTVVVLPRVLIVLDGCELLQDAACGVSPRPQVTAFTVFLEEIFRSNSNVSVLGTCATGQMNAMVNIAPRTVSVAKMTNSELVEVITKSSHRQLLVEEMIQCGGSVPVKGASYSLQTGLKALEDASWMASLQGNPGAAVEFARLFQTEGLLDGSERFRQLAETAFANVQASPCTLEQSFKALSVDDKQSHPPSGSTNSVSPPTPPAGGKDEQDISKPVSVSPDTVQDQVTEVDQFDYADYGALDIDASIMEMLDGQPEEVVEIWRKVCISPGRKSDWIVVLYQIEHSMIHRICECKPEEARNLSESEKKFLLRRMNIDQADQISIVQYVKLMTWLVPTLEAMRCCRSYYNMRDPVFIRGFIGAEESEKLLTGENIREGNFILRFSESRPGFLVLAWVTLENAIRKIQKIILVLKSKGEVTRGTRSFPSLLEYIKSDAELVYLYPNIDKNSISSP